MKEMKKTIEDHYLTFVTVAIGTVAVITLVVWLITYYVKKVKNDSID